MTPAGLPAATARALLAAALAAGCADGAPRRSTEPPDLTEALGPDQARAGVIVDEAAAFGGLAAEGRAGDLKIYNDRVQFVIQGPREGHYYVSQAGMVVDADLVRPPGEAGRDLVDEWGTMLGLGRIVDPVTIEVVEDGSGGRPAVIRVAGRDRALPLLEGALELPGFVVPLDVDVVQEYRLAPASWLLEVRTTLTARSEVNVSVGDLLMAGPEVASRWAEGIGLGDEDGAPRTWAGYVGDRADLAVAMIAAPGQPRSAAGLELVAELADMVVGATEPVDLAPGETHTSVRYYGVGPDLATLSDAALALHGIATERVEGVVSAADGEVSGARVNVLVDGAPYTVAFSGRDPSGPGRFAADVPRGAAWSVLADGQGTGLFTDLPAGGAPHGPYASESTRRATLDSLLGVLPGAPTAAGRGFGSPSEPLVLGVPVPLGLHAADGLPFAAWVDALDPAPARDPRLMRDPPSGHVAAGWSRDGELELLLPAAGRYRVVAHRGVRFELHDEEVEVAGPSRLEIDLAQAYPHPGWLVADPHSHASPSPDGQITMEDRLVVAAATGVQVHFGTDHDHLADYRPLLGPLGLETVLASVVADEVSPPLRGHLNVYPVEPDPRGANNGAWRWWDQIPPTTTWITDELRARHGAGSTSARAAARELVIQMNHPFDSGVAAAAGVQGGRIASPDRWTDDFQAIELLNAGDTELGLYTELVARGHLVAPVGVSDSHSHFGGEPGMNVTFLGVGIDDPRALGPELVREAIARRRTVVSRGVYLATSVAPGSVITAPAELQVEALSPSWARTETLTLLRDGEAVEVVEGTRATFLLDAPADASFVVVAEGTAPMLPLSGRTPWAATSAILLDVRGDGWDPPLPPLR